MLFSLCHHCKFRSTGVWTAGLTVKDIFKPFWNLFLYLERVRSFPQFFDDCRQSFRVDALLTESHTYGQRLHVQTSVQQPGDLQQHCWRNKMTDSFITDMLRALYIFCQQFDYKQNSHNWICRNVTFKYIYIYFCCLFVFEPLKQYDSWTVKLSNQSWIHAHEEIDMFI